ncbi:phage protein [Pseudomonas sp. ES3-33]|uniref:phage protein n=1 Tax=Pseudomonas sp. ES3-33 TaxID=1628833 RepID=UPI0005D2D91F|nr:phage protein [Pseudomonas sp. ES3-33]KJH75345.1 phage protein [Pseudomonas sp. ES3-33]
MAVKQPDWERIEQLFRAGLLSVREIASACGVSHTAINKRSKTEGWDRDLNAKIKAKADSLVSKREVSTKVSTETLATERGIVEANAEVIADIRMAHRTDIGRSRRLANKLLDELEGLTDEQGTLKELIAQLKDSDDGDGPEMSDVLALAGKMASLPSRTKTMKELAETLKTLVALERQAYDLDTKSGGNDADELSKLMDDLSKDA